MAESHWIAPNPPPCVLENPQSQLDSYLSTFDEESLDAENDDEMTTKTRQDELLNLTEFLYGNNALVAALTLLDSSSSITTNAPSIVKISSPPTAGQHHRRSVHLVHSSKGIESYLCFTKRDNGLDYCSCRSFLEKATKSSKSKSQSPQQQHNNITLCKHLLALKLAPYLIKANNNFVETTMATHQEFAKVILERTLPASGIAPKRNLNTTTAGGI